MFTTIEDGLDELEMQRMVVFVTDESKVAFSFVQFFSQTFCTHVRQGSREMLQNSS